MTESLTLFFPCDALPIRVRYSYNDRISPVETTALRLIAAKTTAGRLDSAELSGLLGLSRRVVLDLLQDLWKQGYVTLDFATGTVGLSSGTAEAYAAGGLERLPSAETVEETAEIMLDRIGGFLCPAPRKKLRLDPDSAVRHPRPELVLRDVPHSELLRALRAHVDRLGREERGDRRPQRLVTAGLSPSALGRQPARAWLPVEVTAARDQATGRLVVTIVDEHYPEKRRARAEQVLGELAERHAQDPFVRRLASLADLSLPARERPNLRARIEGFVERVARSSQIVAGKRWDWHLELEREARTLAALLDLRVRSEMRVEPVPAARHPDTVRGLIAQARTQLVLVCPWIEYRTFVEYEDALRAARERGVQIVIVWGMNHRQKLEERAEHSIDSLGRSPSAADVVRSALPARVHAKAVICDDVGALVTSHNMLSSPGRRRELGLLVTAPSRDGSDVVRELLDWVRAVVPDGPNSRKVLSREADFRLDERSSEGAAADPPAPLPFPAASSDLDDAEPDRVAVWAGAWSGYAEALQAEFAARTLPGVEAVTDGRHRELLWRAMERARRRLLITSDQVSEDVVDDRFAAALARRLADPNGPRITLVYGRESDKNGSGARAVTRLRELVRQYPGRLTLDRSDSHAKVLVCDEEVVVGSFNFLSYAGHHTLGSPLLQRSELSLRLVDSEVSDRIVTDWRVKETAAARAHRGEPGPLAGAVVPRISTPVQRLLDPMLEAAGDPVRLRAAVAGLPSDDPWTLLEALEAVDAVTVLRTAVPHALSGRDPGAEQVRRWRRWLVGDLWRREKYVEAAVLRLADPDTEPRPRRPLALVAAARGTASAEDALLAAVYADPDPDEEAALLVTAMTEAVRRGSTDARDMIAFLRLAEDEPWCSLISLCDVYLEKAGHMPLSFGAAGGFVEQSRLRAREDDAWERLERALAAARQLAGKIDIAKKILVAFFRDDGRFGRLDEALAHRSVQGMQRFLTHPLARRGDIGAQLTTLIVQTGAEVSPTTPPLQHAYLKSFVKRLRPVVEQARILADLAEESNAAPHGDDSVGTAAADLKAGLSDLLPALHATVHRRPPAEQRLLTSALADLTAPLDLRAADE